MNRWILPVAGLLAATPCAWSGIVHVPLNIAGPAAPGDRVLIDIAGDSAAEFVFWYTPGGDKSFPGHYRVPVAGVEVLQGPELLSFYNPQRLAAGADIGPGMTIPDGYAWTDTDGSWMFFGSWWDGVPGYMPFRLAGSDGYRYGWLHIDPPFESFAGHFFIGAAYETTPGATIAAGQVPAGTSGLALALGLGLGLRPRRR